MQSLHRLLEHLGDPDAFRAEIEDQKRSGGVFLLARKKMETAVWRVDDAD